MSDKLIKRVADLVRFNADPLAIAEEAIALIRADTLEEAARVVALMPRTYDKIKQDHDVLGMRGTWTLTLNNGPAECAAAIRALKDRT